MTTSSLHISIEHTKLKTVNQFTYLGCTISSDARIDKEIDNRLAKANSAFGRLHKRVWKNNQLKNLTKISVYRAIVIPTLLLGSESWILYRHHLWLLERFHQCCLCSILNIHWSDFITNIVVLEMAEADSIESTLLKIQLRWVEFSYPPLIPEEGHDGHSLPEEWKYLPFLALPDGAHNYQEDTIYFHLPPRSGGQKTVYGVSCYRQIDAKTLKVRQADVTRETVQKSVCVLSKLPLYGLLQAKLQLITHAYFEEKDFSQISILKELYEHMNSSLGGNALEGSQAYLSLSPRDLVLHFRHKTIILFKLILLEKKVLFYLSPVNGLVGTLMTVLSLFPGMVEHGLTDSSQYKPRSSTSEDVVFQEHGVNTEEFVSVSVSDVSSVNSEFSLEMKYPAGDPEISDPAKVVTFSNVQRTEQVDNRLQLPLQPPVQTSPNSSESDWETLDTTILDADNGAKEETLNEKNAQKEVFISDSLVSHSLPITVQPQANTTETVITPGLISGLEEDQYGMPLAIFTKGYLCLPYMALQQHHLLSDVSVRGFVAGATNILFRQQKHLSDAVVDIEEAGIQTHDPELRKLLNLTTADLRFADFLVKHVTENRDDVFLDGTGWEGGDEWIRAQFSLYIHSLLATTLQPAIRFRGSTVYQMSN
ncbi:late secretory pathway protein AVL9 homolog isoform X2 [Narcine bancroftii]|uniref:late secretory pathway protein AVL9 homolog isoform X2 n=1 Tax=Narcine bancroftii TaxID=1343680 RepID=UPI003831C1F0